MHLDYALLRLFTSTERTHPLIGKITHVWVLLFRFSAEAPSSKWLVFSEIVHFSLALGSILLLEFCLDKCHLSSSHLYALLPPHVLTHV